MPVARFIRGADAPRLGGRVPPSLLPSTLLRSSDATSRSFGAPSKPGHGELRGWRAQRLPLPGHGEFGVGRTKRDQWCPAMVKWGWAAIGAVAVGIACLCCATVAYAQPMPGAAATMMMRPQARVARIETSEAPVIDADFSDLAWAKATVIDHLKQRLPNPGAMPT